MSDFIVPVAQLCSAIIEAMGIGVITLIAIYELLHSVVRLVKKEDREEIFQQLRQNLGKGILLGLEFLIAADIIYTVAVDFTYESVSVLAVIILLRTFLSFTLEVELTGRWPWQVRK